jgi:hypothetical protein
VPHGFFASVRFLMGFVFVIIVTIASVCVLHICFWGQPERMCTIWTGRADVVVLLVKITLTLDLPSHRSLRSNVGMQRGRKPLSWLQSSGLRGNMFVSSAVSCGDELRD